MATTLTAGNLVVKITESLTVNGKNYGNENTLTIATVKEPDLRIVTVPTSEKTLIAFGAAIGAGTYVESDVRYIRITNKDGTNFVTLNIEGDASTDFSVRLDPGASFLIISSSATGVVDYADISGATLEDLTAIKATADTADVDVELFVVVA